MLHGIVPDSQQNGLGNKGGIDNVIRGVSTSIVGENNGDTNLILYIKVEAFKEALPR